MIISPPFLPAGDDTDDNWLNAAMSSPQNEGAYPMTNGLAWHGGLHLISPSLPVRAIADGTVAYMRPATRRNQVESDPLNYQAGAHVSGWTSDGCVVIRHDTEIGEGINATVRYFSIYMHLESIPAAIESDAVVYRKDVLGQAGFVNGQTNRIHLEIICDDVNLLKLVGRSSGNTTLTANGRINAVYGDTYFQLPVGTVIYAPKSNAEQSIPAATPVAVHTTDTELFVGIRYAGDGFVSTYQADGTQVGTTLQENDFEYNLLKKATDLHTQCPSAAFELLRFGRVLGPDVLAPADTPHWRRICYPGGQGLVNLAPATIHKFSDADFPHWRGWTLVDDSADLDSRMDAALIRAWLDPDHDDTVTPEEARSQLNTTQVQAKLKGVICKTPTEWNAATINARWGWLKTITPEHPEKLEDEDFENLKKHITKLCFWEAANLGIDANHWHFDPREFIRHFRKCGWLSVRELAQCLPRRSLIGVVAWPEAFQRSTTHSLYLNVMARKYLGASKKRLAHTLAQIYIETGLLGTVTEGGSGTGHSYTAFFGRGYMQLTWATNYKLYGIFKNISNLIGGTYSDNRVTRTSSHPLSDGGANIIWYPRYDPALVLDLNHSAESSGFYWISKTFRGVSNINRACDLALDTRSVGFISWLVNGGGNGYVHRQQFFQFLINVLLDQVPLSGSPNFHYAPLTPRVNLGTVAKPNYCPLLCSTFPPVNVGESLVGVVHYEAQRPNGR